MGAVFGALLLFQVACGPGASRSPEASYAHALAVDAMGYTKEAGHWYRKAAYQGHPLAQVEVGFMYKYGRAGFLRDPYEAEGWFGRAMWQDSYVALADFGFVYEYGESGVVRNDWEAERWFREAVISCRKAAARGDLAAQTILGGLYGTGTGAKRDRNLALRLWQDAAARGYAPAQYRLARAYWQREDYEAALPWMMRAAQQGLPEAAYYLSVMYQVGYGIEPDWEQAVVWLRRSAKQGYLFAQRQLQGMEATGLLRAEGRKPFLQPQPSFDHTAAKLVAPMDVVPSFLMMTKAK